MAKSAFEQLEKGSYQEFENLIDLHDRFALSSDPFMRYSSGWAAIYAAQRANRYAQKADAVFAQQLAVERWTEVDRVAPSMYQADPEVLFTQAQLALAMSPQISMEQHMWSQQQRLHVAQNVGEIALKCIPIMARGNQSMTGELAEIACLQLIWRESEHTGTVQNIVNGIPAGPAKDQRRGRASRYSTDIYAHLTNPDVRSKSINVQVKSRLRNSDYRRYGDIVALIGANTHYGIAGKGHRTGLERIKFTAEACAAEANNQGTEEHNAIIQQSSASVYRTIHEKMIMRNPWLLPKEVTTSDSIPDTAQPN